MPTRPHFLDKAVIQKRERISRISPTFPQGPTFLFLRPERVFSQALRSCAASTAGAQLHGWGCMCSNHGGNRKKSEILPPPHTAPVPVPSPPARKRGFSWNLFSMCPLHSSRIQAGPVQHQLKNMGRKPPGNSLPCWSFFKCLFPSLVHLHLSVFFF